MIKTLLFFLLIIFAVGGVCEFVYTIRLLLFIPKRSFNSYVFVVLDKEIALKQLAFIWQKIVWHGENFATGIIAVTDNLDTKEIVSCNTFANNKKIFLCTFDDLNEIKFRETL